MPFPAYLTLSDVKQYWPTNEVATTSVFDTLITTLCTNVSRAFDRQTFRNPGDYAVAADTIRYYDGVSPFATDFLLSLFLRSGPGNLTDELASLTEVAIAPNGGNTFTPVNSGDFLLWPYDNDQRGRPFTRIDLTGLGTVTSWPIRPHSVRITGKFGYSTSVPSDVFEALLLWVIKMVRKSQTNYLKTGSILDSGQVFVGYDVDDDLKQLIGLYKKGSV